MDLNASAVAAAWVLRQYLKENERNAEVGMRNGEVGMRKSECGSRNGEVGMRK